MEYTITVTIETPEGVKATVKVDACTEKDVEFFVANTPLAWSIPLNRQLKGKV